MRPIRLLIANEPRFYREAIAASVRHLRPHVEVLAVEPDKLARHAILYRPQVLLCSCAADLADVAPLASVLFPADDREPVVVSFNGRQRIVPTLGLDHLLAVIDAAAHLATS